MMFVFMVVWLWNDITRMGHRAKKRFLERRYHVVRILLRPSSLPSEMLSNGNIILCIVGGPFENAVG